MIVGAVADPLKWDRWPEAEALLEPARARGDFPSAIEPDEVLYIVMDGDELLAAATAWLGKCEGETFVEVKLVGGRHCLRWLKQLDERIGADASNAGATRLIGIGRASWTRILKRLGWVKCQPVEDHWLFERGL